MKKPIVFGWIMGLAAVFLILSCSFYPDIPIGASDTPENPTGREFLALLKTRDSHTVSEEQLEAMIKRFLNPATAGRSAAAGETAVVTGKTRLDISGTKRFEKSGEGRSAAGEEEGPVEIYNFVTQSPESENPGFVLACNDVRIGNILAVVEEGAIDDEEAALFMDIVFKNLPGYINHTIDEYNSITDEEMVRAVENANARAAGRKIVTINGETYYDNDPNTAWLGDEENGYGSAWISDGESNIGYGLAQSPEFPDVNIMPAIVFADWVWTEGRYATVNVRWNQNGPYNWAVNLAHEVSGSASPYIYANGVYSFGGNGYFTGCGPVAVAQLMAYYGRPAKYTLSTAIAGKQPNSNYNWTAMRSSATKTSINNSGALDISVLMYEIGHRAGSIYDQGESTSTYDNGLIDALQDMGYNVPGTSYDTYGDIKYFKTYNISSIRSSLANGRPVLIGGYRHFVENTTGQLVAIGHAWLIDGVRTMTYNETFINASSCNFGGQAYYVRCNLGWGRSYNAWYKSGIFDTNHVSLARSAESENERVYEYDLGILADVRPAN